MRILRAKDYPVKPWKNGGGKTAEIVVFPTGSGMADFDWRLSMATVAEDGPFSLFPGIDRTLFVLDGDGIELTFEHNGVEKIKSGEHLAFSAEVPAASRLLGDIVTDLNIMTNRCKFKHIAYKTACNESLNLKTGWDTAIIFAVSNDVSIVADQMPIQLNQYDCAVFNTPQSFDVELDGSGDCIVVGIYERSSCN